MQLDDLLMRYFGVTDLAEAGGAAVDAGIERALVDLGLERDRGIRFAIWSMLYLLDRAPELDVTFDDAGDRDAARSVMDLIAASEAEEGTARTDL
jgi:hypothetical protein